MSLEVGDGWRRIRDAPPSPSRAATVEDDDDEESPTSADRHEARQAILTNGHEGKPAPCASRPKDGDHGDSNLPYPLEDGIERLLSQQATCQVAEERAQAERPSFASPVAAPRSPRTDPGSQPPWFSSGIDPGRSSLDKDARQHQNGADRFEPRTPLRTISGHSKTNGSSVPFPERPHLLPRHRGFSEEQLQFLPSKYRQVQDASVTERPCTLNRAGSGADNTRTPRDKLGQAYRSQSWGKVTQSPSPLSPGRADRESLRRQASLSVSKYPNGEQNGRERSWNEFHKQGLGIDLPRRDGSFQSENHNHPPKASHSRHDLFSDDRRDTSADPRTVRTQLKPAQAHREASTTRDHQQENKTARSPRPPAARMASLTVNTGMASNASLATAAPSPLLDSYRGTYQDCSPMPSPLLLASRSPRDVTAAHASEAPSPVVSDLECDAKRHSRRARFHDPEDVAHRLAASLQGHRTLDTAPLIELLPSLTHEQFLELRHEYKQIVKTGADRRGVNVAKHIRARLKDEDPLLMKTCYAVALSRWESEAYWASFWSQSDRTRRELLIEALMGRPNHEIHFIKEGFADKRYDDSLTRCIKNELKEDKFKKAVLMVLGGKRMDDRDGYGRTIPLDDELVEQDVHDLRRAIKADRGGETTMIGIVLRRSDQHLGAVLAQYEHRYRANFAREALKKSGNLVCELLAHILNGVINRPVRDALLLHHALTASRKDPLRRELLVSRLVRYHWDAAHMLAVNRAFRDRYGVDVQRAVREATAGSPWGRFCAELCIARVPNDVRRLGEGGAS